LIIAHIRGGGKGRATMAAEVEHLQIIDPSTGEVADLKALTDRELDQLQLHLNWMAHQYEQLERITWDEIKHRAIAQGGLQGVNRRWVVATVKTAHPRTSQEG
jgi:hypothetical protein